MKIYIFVSNICLNKLNKICDAIVQQIIFRQFYIWKCALCHLFKLLYSSNICFRFRQKRYQTSLYHDIPSDEIVLFLLHQNIVYKIKGKLCKQKLINTIIKIRLDFSRLTERNMNSARIIFAGKFSRLQRNFFNHYHQGDEGKSVAFRHSLMVKEAKLTKYSEKLMTISSDMEDLIKHVNDKSLGERWDEVKTFIKLFKL